MDATIALPFGANTQHFGSMEVFARNASIVLDRLRWSQRKLADEMGVGTGTVSRWLSCRTTPSIEDATKMADVLGVSLDELTGRVTAYDSLSGPERSVIDLMRALGLDHQVALRRLAVAQDPRGWRRAALADDRVLGRGDGTNAVHPDGFP